MTVAREGDVLRFTFTAEQAGLMLNQLIAMHPKGTCHIVSSLSLADGDAILDAVRKSWATGDLTEDLLDVIVDATRRAYTSAANHGEIPDTTYRTADGGVSFAMTLREAWQVFEFNQKLDEASGTTLSEKGWSVYEQVAEGMLLFSDDEIVAIGTEIWGLDEMGVEAYREVVRTAREEAAA